MTRELGTVARSLVAVAREGLGPDAATAARVRARVASSVGSTAGAVAATTSNATTSLPSAVASTSIVLKVAGVLALAGAAIVGTTIASHQRSSRTVITDPSSGRPDTGRPNAGRPNAGRSDVSRPDAGRPDVVRPPGGRAVAVAVAGQASLAREVELIDRAMAALRLGRAADALATIKIFDRETADHGQLAEDAAAIEIEARCLLRELVTDRLGAFDRRWPTSAQRARLTAACTR